MSNAPIHALENPPFSPPLETGPETAFSTKSATLCLATPKKATFRTPSAHHEISGKWKPRPSPCCVVSPLACREPSTAVVISNHGAGARYSPSAQRNASFAPPTKSFGQGTRENDAARKTLLPSPPRKRGPTSVGEELDSRLRGNDRRRASFTKRGWFSHLSTGEK